MILHHNATAYLSRDTKPPNHFFTCFTFSPIFEENKSKVVNKLKVKYLILAYPLDSYVYFTMISADDKKNGGFDSRFFQSREQLNH